MWIKRFQRLSPAQRVATVASAAAVAVWTAVWVVPDVHEVTPAEARVESAALQEPADGTAPAVHPESAKQPLPPLEVHAAKAPAPEGLALDNARARIEALRAGLASDNSGTRIEALRKVAEQRSTDALPELLRLDVARDADIAPTLIQVTGQLAQQAEPPQRAAAASKLADWLKTERARPQADARANVSVLVETLGTVQDPQAETALTEVLQSDQLPLHVQTLAVEGLAKLASPTAQTALRQFRERLGQSERQGFELELQREAEHATDRALARLSR